MHPSWLSFFGTFELPHPARSVENTSATPQPMGFHVSPVQTLVVTVLVWLDPWNQICSTCSVDSTWYRCVTAIRTTARIYWWIYGLTILYTNMRNLHGSPEDYHWGLQVLILEIIRFGNIHGFTELSRKQKKAQKGSGKKQGNKATKESRRNRQSILNGIPPLISLSFINQAKN